jgi:hypothetical protein
MRAGSRFWILEFGFWNKEDRAIPGGGAFFNPKSKIQNPKFGFM